MRCICTPAQFNSSIYFMPQQQVAAAAAAAAADHQADSAATACGASTSPAAAMWEYHQLQPHAALQPSSSSFPYSYWSPYSGSTTASALLAGDQHGWSHGELSNSTGGYRENFLDLLASKNVTPEMFEEVPAAEHYNVSPPIKYEITGSPLFLGSATTIHQQMSMMSGTPPSCYSEHHHHHLTKEGNSNHQQELAVSPMASFLQQISSGSANVGVNSSLDYSGLGDQQPDTICQGGREMDASPFSMRSLPDLGSFAGYTSAMESTSVQPYMRCANSSDSNRQEQETVPARSSSSGSGAATDRKKRKSEERQESTGKKSKQEASKASPPKQQVPKVKLGEKITALQQIVSPFGKTDTASVLFETIKYIKFLHEQVQLLSEPYTNSSRSKGNNIPWSGQAEASKGETEHDLRNRGLCLVPVSWTPEVYRDGNAMDYWTPAYRGCLYR